MKLCRFGDGRDGLVQGDSIIDLSGLQPPDTRPGPLPWALSQPASVLDRVAAHAPRVPLADAALLSPLAAPPKVVAAPVNYRAHVQEMLASGQAHGHTLTDIRQAGMFLKASSSVVGPSQGIAQRFLDRRTDHEIELCAVIGRAASRVRAAEALEHVAGYCLGLDITVRGPEDRSFRKSIDSYCVLGPWVVTPDEVGNPDDVNLELLVNGTVRQRANTSDMVLSMAELIEFASSFYTLQPGDVLMTGTPQGVGPIRPGDMLVVRGSGLGEFTTHVREA